MSDPTPPPAPVFRTPNYKQEHRSRVAGPIEAVWRLFERQHESAPERVKAKRNSSGKIVWSFQLPPTERGAGEIVYYRETTFTRDVENREATYELNAGEMAAPGDLEHTLRLTIKLTAINLHETAVLWTSRDALFNHTLIGFQSKTFESLREFADEAYPPRFLFAEHVFPAELDVIRQRAGREPRTEGDKLAIYNRVHQSSRLASEHGRYDPRDEEVCRERPTTRHGLVGLALSGGGIRSSTFNLGVLQGLHRIGVLRHVDYLSTVSGGGYIGSAWSALTSKGADFPFAGDPNGGDAPAVNHLRKFGNYLVPRGLGDWIRMGMAVVRGVFLNFLLMVPILMLLAVFTALIAGSDMRQAVRAWSLHPGYRHLFDALGAFWLTRRLIVVYIVWLLASAPLTKLMAWMGSRLPVSQKNDPVSWSLRRVMSLVGERSESKSQEPDASAATASYKSSREYYALRDGYERTFAAGVIVIAAVALIEAQPLLLSVVYVIQSGRLHRLPALLAFGAMFVVTGWGLSRISSVVVQRVALLIAGFISPLLVSWIYFALSRTLIFESHAWPFSQHTQYAGELTGAIVAMGMIFYARLFVDVNLHSGHGFWRDRLSRAFLIAPRSSGRVDPRTSRLEHVDAIRLSEMNATLTADARPEAPEGRMPYHLLNVTLNLQADRSLVNSGRMGDFFLFSPRFIGGARTGYIPTPVLEQLDSHLNLGTAMAISSAAAAPNMGFYTNPSVRFLMALFNIRMGYWVAHPDRVKRMLGVKPSGWNLSYDQSRKNPGILTRIRMALWQATPRYLLFEMLGAMSDRRDLVNVSDGGHLENLGAFELLRRRCRYIIVGDGDADGGMQFQSLAKLILYARLDLDVEISVVIDDLSLSADKARRQHCAIGSIRYPAREGEPPEPEGTLIYFKSSLTGDEDSMIAHYHAACPEFPHETTADQFFSEEQLEAYRSLGSHVATGLFAGAERPSKAPPDTELSYADFQAMIPKLSTRLR